MQASSNLRSNSFTRLGILCPRRLCRTWIDQPSQTPWRRGGPPGNHSIPLDPGQSIPFEHQYVLEDYTTAAVIFNALEQRYNTQSRLQRRWTMTWKPPHWYAQIFYRYYRWTYLQVHYSRGIRPCIAIFKRRSCQMQSVLRILVHARIDDENWIGCHRVTVLWLTDFLWTRSVSRAISIDALIMDPGSGVV